MQSTFVASGFHSLLQEHEGSPNGSAITRDFRRKNVVNCEPDDRGLLEGNVGKFLISALVLGILERVAIAFAIWIVAFLIWVVLVIGDIAGYAQGGQRRRERGNG